MEDTMLEFIEQAIKLLVDKPDEVKVDIVETEQRIIYELTVGDGDYGKVIGKVEEIFLQFVLLFLLSMLNRVESVQDLMLSTK